MSRMTKITLMLALVLGVGGSALKAAGDTLVVRVPFAFVVGTQTLPAGEYRVQPYSETGLLMIQGFGGHSSAMVFSTPSGYGSSSSDAALLFSSRGGQHVLSGVQFLGQPARVVAVK